LGRASLAPHDQYESDAGLNIGFAARLEKYYCALSGSHGFLFAHHVIPHFEIRNL
jgi:hypothetical protein